MTEKHRNKNPLKSSHNRPDASRSLEDDMLLKARFWIEKNDETFLASGRIALLKMIDQCGSISSAAEAMGISYRHAWNLIDKMNTLAGEPLLVTDQGGKGGGGAKLTPKAQLIVKKFDQLRDNFEELITEINFSIDSE